MASELVGRCRLKLAETRAPQDKSKCDQMMTEVKTLFNAQSGGICPNLVEFYDAFWEDPFMYLAMEYMDCGSLDVPFKRCAQVRPISDLSPSMPRPSMRPRAHTHTHMLPPFWRCRAESRGSKRELWGEEWGN